LRNNISENKIRRGERNVMKCIPSQLRLLAILVWLTVVVGIAQAGSLTINVFTAIGPNPIPGASPESITAAAAWSANALQALESGATAYGTPGTPGYYQQVSSFAATDVIGTNFPYWRGVSDPTGAYTNQNGNMLMYPMAVYGNGTQFTAADVSFVDDFFATGPVTTQLSTVPYGPRMVGINLSTNTRYGAGGVAGTSTTLVDVLFFSGFGDQFGSLTTPGDPMTRTELSAGVGEILAANTPFAPASYSALGQTGSVDPQMIPEPATLSFGAIGVLVLGLRARRKSRV
jgi:hypothetical protein